MFPLYQKISDELKAQITNEEIKIGEKLPTEMELAESYKVSRITAKRALNELELLGLVERTRGKGTFVKNSRDLTIKSGSKIILFIHPFGELSFGDFTEGIIPFMKNHNYTVFITHPDYLLETEPQQIQQNFDGLIYYPLNTDQYLDTLFELSQLNFPIVLLDKEIYGLPFPCVKADNFSGGKLATRYLIELGHKNIAFITNDDPHHPHTTRDRYLGYIEALNEAKLPYHSLLSNDLTETSRKTFELITNKDISAIVCENDVVALSMITAVQKLNYKVPEDISIVGYDDIQASSLSNPPLTTIAQNFSEMGSEAARLLIKWITKGKISASSKIPVKLIERNTVKEIR